MNDNDIIAQLHALATNVAHDRGHASFLLRRAAREYGRSERTCEPSPLAGVPTELVMCVINGVLAEDVAIARGKKAAAAKTFEERDAILSGLEAKPEPAGRQATTDRPVGPPPWGEP